MYTSSSKVCKLGRIYLIVTVVLLFKVIFYLQTIWRGTNPLQKTVLDYNEFVAGNVWAQEWAQTYNMTVPHPNKASVDVSPTMVAQVSWVAVKVFYVEKWAIGDSRARTKTTHCLLTLRKHFNENFIIQWPIQYIRSTVCACAIVVESFDKISYNFCINFNFGNQ